jgi:hypothetical protein
MSHSDVSALQRLTPYEWLLVGVICSPIAALYAWGFIRVRRARADIRRAIRAEGMELLTMRQRWFRLGPLFWTTTRGQVVYRLTVRDSSGRSRTGWARWGRTWLPRADTLEIRWDD